MARLLDAPEQYPQFPLHYLIGCYDRATAEMRALSSLRDKGAANRLQQDLQYCKELIASNAGLLLTMPDSLFPQVSCTVTLFPDTQQMLESISYLQYVLLRWHVHQSSSSDDIKTVY